MVAAGGDPAKKAHKEGSGRDRAPGGRTDVEPSVPSASYVGKPNRIGEEDAAKHRERRRSSPSENGVVGGVGVPTGNAGGVSPSAAPRHYRRGSTGGRASADVGGRETGAPSSNGTSSSMRIVNWQREGGVAGVSGEVAFNRDGGGGRDGRAGSRAGLVPGEEDREQRHRGSSTSTIDPATSRYFLVTDDDKGVLLLFFRGAGAGCLKPLASQETCDISTHLALPPAEVVALETPPLFYFQCDQAVFLMEGLKLNFSTITYVHVARILLFGVNPPPPRKNNKIYICTRVGGIITN